MFSFSTRSLTLFLSISLLSGCAIGPDFTRPEQNLPEKYREATVSGEDVANLPWWNLYSDPALQNLVRIALAENKDLQIATERVEASRALLGVTRADQFPRLDGSANAGRSDSSDEILSIITTKPRNDFGLFADLSFEIDIWGKLRRATEAQRAELLASEYGRRTVIQSLVSQVAITYFRVLGAGNRIDISNRTFKNRSGATKIITARFQKGMIPQLDVNQAEIDEAEALIAATVYERDRRLAENALSVLLGRPSAPIIQGSLLEKQNLTTAIPAGFPAALLERRPDVLSAEALAHAAVARIGVAKAGQLPSLNLLGFVGLQSSDTSNLLRQNAFTWGYGGQLLGPIFDWGKSWSQVDLAEAQARVAYEQYGQTVLRSVQEVEDALVSIRTYKQEYDYRTRQVKSASNAARLSRARYDDGVTSYLEVLDVERSLFESELGASSALQSYYSSIVQLFKALGGGWKENETPAGGA